MAHWLKMLLGPLPATLLLLPFLLAGGMGAGIGLLSVLFAPTRPATWPIVAATGFILVWVGAAAGGVLALWAMVLADPAAGLREGASRWLLVAGLGLGIIAAGGWLWTMVGQGDGLRTWAVWLGLLLGPMVLGSYYLVLLLRR